jgi:hypothetical protein
MNNDLSLDSMGKIQSTKRYKLQALQEDQLFVLS